MTRDASETNLINKWAFKSSYSTMILNMGTAGAVAVYNTHNSRLDVLGTTKHGRASGLASFCEAT